MFAYQGIQVSAAELAERACTIELDRCAKPIGKQDQYAAAFGGICDMRFGPGDRVNVDQIRLAPRAQRELQGELMLFYTGITRSADTILKEQSANIGVRLQQLNLLRDLAGEAADGLRVGDTRAVGVALAKSWDAKRMLATGVSNPQLDDAVEGALAAGATGAKVAGRAGVARAGPLPGRVPGSGPGGVASRPGAPIKIDPYGSRVIFNVHRDIWG